MDFNRGIFRIWSNIYNGAFCENTLWLSAVNYFCKKKLHCRCSSGLKTGFWLRIWNIGLTVVPGLQIMLRKYQAGKYVWHRFWKGKSSWWESKHRKCFMQKQPSKAGYLKKVSREISQNSPLPKKKKEKIEENKRKRYGRNLFFERVKLWRSATILKTIL